MTMKSTDFLMIVAIVAVGLAAVNLITTINKIGDFKTLSGLVTDTGTANLTVTSNAQINFTTRTVEWGSGHVSDGDTSCELDTLDHNNCTGFSNNNVGLVLQNIGNENVKFNLTSSKNAASFIGGSSPVFEFNSSEVEAGSCPPGLDVTSWTTLSTTPTDVCSNFTFDTTDTIRIDLRVVLPNNAGLGFKTTTITADASVV